MLTALKRDPARRYASVGAFAADLKSYLDGAPISPRAATACLYRAYKFARRHRLPGIAATACRRRHRHCRRHDRDCASGQPPPPIAPGSAMAIVDFNNLSQDKDSAWLAPSAGGNAGHPAGDRRDPACAAGRTCARPALALQSWLAPPARHATLRTRPRGGPPKRLGTDYVLSGSYPISGDAERHEGASGSGHAGCAQWRCDCQSVAEAGALSGPAGAWYARAGWPAR